MTYEGKNDMDSTRSVGHTRSFVSRNKGCKTAASCRWSEMQ